MSRFIECCCTDPDEVREAKEGGASRAELCYRLSCGGLTPAYMMIKEAMAVGIPVNVLVRPRPGNFVYDEDEVDRMIGSIDDCRQLGVNGIVIGALDASGNVDMEAMKRMMEAAEGIPVTFHRGFDECADPQKALEDIISLGCARLLTSGHSADALAGKDTLAALVKQAAGRIVIMPGKGVRPENIAEIERTSGAVEFHSSAHSSSGRTDRSVVRELVDGPSEVGAE